MMEEKQEGKIGLNTSEILCLLKYHFMAEFMVGQKLYIARKIEPLSFRVYKREREQTVSNTHCEKTNMKKVNKLLILHRVIFIKKH